MCSYAKTRSNDDYQSNACMYGNILLITTDVKSLHMWALKIYWQIKVIIFIYIVYDGSGGGGGDGGGCDDGVSGT